MTSLITFEELDIPALTVIAQEQYEECLWTIEKALDKQLIFGRLLLIVKSKLPHGEWGNWVRETFADHKSLRTIQRYMRGADSIATDPSLLECADSLDSILKIVEDRKPSVEVIKGAASVPQVVIPNEQQPDVVDAVVAELIETPATTKPHVSHNGGNNEWYTPTEFIEAATMVMGAMDAIQLISEPDSVLFDENALDAIQAICPIFADRIDELGMTFFDRSLAEPARYLCVFKQVHETLLKSFVPSQPAATSDEQPKPAATKELTMEQKMTNEKRRLVRTAMKEFSNPASLCKPMRLRMHEETSEEERNSTVELIDAPGSVVFSCKALNVIRTLSPAIADKIINAGKTFTDRWLAVPRWLVCISGDDFASILKSMADDETEPSRTDQPFNDPTRFYDDMPEVQKTDDQTLQSSLQKMSIAEKVAFSRGIALKDRTPEVALTIDAVTRLCADSDSATYDTQHSFLDAAETLLNALISKQTGIVLKAHRRDEIPF